MAPYPGYKPVRENFLCKIVEVAWPDEKTYIASWFLFWTPQSFSQISLIPCTPPGGPLAGTAVFISGSVSCNWHTSVVPFGAPSAGLVVAGAPSASPGSAINAHLPAMRNPNAPSATVEVTEVALVEVAASLAGPIGCWGDSTPDINGNVSGFQGHNGSPITGIVGLTIIDASGISGVIDGRPANKRRTTISHTSTGGIVTVEFT